MTIHAQSRSAIENVAEIEHKSELELFAELYELQNNRAMSDVQADFVAKMIEECKKGEED